MTHSIDFYLFYVHIRKEIKMNCEDKQETLDETCARICTRGDTSMTVLYCVMCMGDPIILVAQ
jgi:hypothetical protein